MQEIPAENIMKIVLLRFKNFEESRIKMQVFFQYTFSFISLKTMNFIYTPS